MTRLIALLAMVMVAACETAPRQPSYIPAPVYGPPGDARNPLQGPFQPNAELIVCPGNVSNAPAFNRYNLVEDFRPIIVVEGNVVMASVPANDVCLSSGFGPRGGRLHKGADYRPNPRNEPRAVYSAAPGIIREARIASGFGNYVVIDHGFGVFTRYAHLDFFEPWVAPGAEIGFGHALGLMGDSGNASAVHLHFEVLTGNIDTPKGSFGLTAFDPLAYPAWAGLTAGS